MIQYSSLEGLLKDISGWQAQTFPHATEASVREHLRRELVELTDSISVGEYYDAEEESADVLFLLHAWLRFRGLTLAKVLEAKFVVNKARQWKAPDELGVVEHVK